MECRLTTSLLFILKPLFVDGTTTICWLIQNHAWEFNPAKKNPVLRCWPTWICYAWEFNHAMKNHGCSRPHFLLTNIPMLNSLDTHGPGEPWRRASGFWRKSSRSRHHQRGERPGWSLRSDESRTIIAPPKKIENMGFSIILHNGSELLYLYNGDFTSCYILFYLFGGDLLWWW